MTNIDELKAAQEWRNEMPTLDFLDIILKYFKWSGDGYSNEELISWYRSENPKLITDFKMNSVSITTNGIGISGTAKFES